MIDLSVLKDRKHIWISLSGGADSALVLYLMTKYLYDNNLNTKITPWVTVDKTRPGNDKICEEIIGVILSLFPYKHIQPLKIDHINIPPGTDKKSQSAPLWQAMRKSGKYDMFTNGLSASPPIEEMKSIPGFYEKFKLITSEDRSPKQREVYHKDSLVGAVWQPLINLNKQDVAEMYEEHNLMDNIFPLTASCIDREFTPCMKCFWCHEKHWAFGLYDMRGGYVVPN